MIATILRQAGPALSLGLASLVTKRIARTGRGGQGLYEIVLTAVLVLAASQPQSQAVHPVSRCLQPVEVREAVAVSRIQLGSGDYARFSVRQELDVLVTVLDPTGQTLLVVDGPTGRVEPEVVAFVADTAGSYGVEVAVPGREALLGDCTIRLEEQRPASSEDRLAAAEEATVAQVDLTLFKRVSPDALNEAVSAYQAALARSRDSGDLPRQAGLLYRLGLARARLGELEAALGDLKAALALYRQIGNSRGIAGIRNDLARTYRRLGAMDLALAELLESLSLWRELQAEKEEADVSNNLGLLYHLQGQYPEALESYQKALEIHRRAENLPRQAVLLNNIGGIHDALGEAEQSLHHYEEALSITRSLHQPSFETDILNNIGAAHVRQGQFQEALDAYASALDLLQEMKDEQRQPSVLTNLADLLLRLGSPEKAKDVLLRALALLAKSVDRRNEAAVLTNLGTAARQLSELAEAEGFLDRALALESRIGDKPGRVTTLLAKAQLLEDLGRNAEARATLLEALDLSGELGDRVAEVQTRLALGRVEAGRQEAEAARLHLEHAARLAKDLGIAVESARVTQEMASLERSRGNLPAARKYLESSLERFESLRSGIPGDELRTSHFTALRSGYDFYVDVLQQLQKSTAGAGLEAQAFEAAERARARGLLDFFGQARIDLREGDADLLKAERRLRLEMNAKASLRTERLADPKRSAEVEALDRELATLAAEYQLLEARLQASSPRYARLKQPEIRLSQIQQESLESDTVLLEYFLAEPRSYLWIVTPKSLASFELPGRARIEELARRVHERLGRLDPTEASQEREDLKELSRLLLGPVLDRLKGKRVAVVADGALLYLPFSVLPVPAADGSGAEVPLIAENEVVHLPSAAVLRELRRSREERPRPPAALAVLADPIFEKDDPRLQTVAQASTPAPSPEPPPFSLLASLLSRGGEGAFARLPWTRKEAEVITAEAEGRDVLLALDFRASRDLATAEDLGRYRILHFATHGVLDTRRPALSGLVLSQVDERGQARDGFLRLHDVYHLRLNADLVVLSGCETALGKTLRGEGIIGLTRGFFHAGASQVMASLWPVRDRATAELMQRFYRGMFRDGLPASTALRQAQVSMWRERQWRDPYYWAAFVLQGDWRAGR